MRAITDAGLAKDDVGGGRAPRGDERGVEPGEQLRLDLAHLEDQHTSGTAALAVLRAAGLQAV